MKKACFSAALILFFALAAGSAYGVEFDVKNTKVDLGGFIKLYAMYDIDGNLNDAIPNCMGDEASAFSVPLDDAPYADENRFSMTARESRLWLKTKTQTDFGLLSTVFEGDYNLDSDYSTDTWSNSRQFRLRLAAATLKLGNNVVLAGQYWTNFMDFAAGVPIMDLAGDPGQPFVRQPQIQVTHFFNKGHYLSVSVENPDRGLTLNGTPVGLFQHPESTDAETMPDVIVKYFWANKYFHVSPKVLLRRFELNDDDVYGYALSLTSHVGFGKGHKVYLGLTYGEGIGRYAGLGLNAGAGLSDSGEAETVGYMGINTGITLALKENLAWTLGCGYAENDEDDYENGVLSNNATKDAFAWHTMLAWQVTPAIECALGFTAMQRTVMDDREGDMMKVQSYVKYTF